MRFSVPGAQRFRQTTTIKMLCGLCRPPQGRQRYVALISMKTSGSQGNDRLRSRHSHVYDTLTPGNFAVRVTYGRWTVKPLTAWMSFISLVRDRQANFCQTFRMECGSMYLSGASGRTKVLFLTAYCRPDPKSARLVKVLRQYAQGGRAVFMSTTS